MESVFIITILPVRSISFGSSKSVKTMKPARQQNFNQRQRKKGINSRVKAAYR